MYDSKKPDDIGLNFIINVKLQTVTYKSYVYFNL
jgi:hypothetical protein